MATESEPQNESFPLPESETAHNSSVPTERVWFSEAVSTAGSTAGGALLGGAAAGVPGAFVGGAIGLAAGLVSAGSGHGSRRTE